MFNGFMLSHKQALCLGKGGVGRNWRTVTSATSFIDLIETGFRTKGLAQEFQSAPWQLLVDQDWSTTIEFMN